ncbi:MAG: hypothetical protein OXD40_04730 [bacterium]|nr:hypothetical protein [bacterium]
MTQWSRTVPGFGEVAAGTKVELWMDGGPVGWGAVAVVLPGRQVVIDRFDEDEAFVADLEADGGEVYVDDWSPEVRELMAERRRLLWQPAAVDHYDVPGVGRVMVGTKLEIADENGPADWGEVTGLLTGRRVAVHWYNAENTSIAGVEAGSDLYVDDWSAAVYDILRARAKGERHGQA